MKNRPHDRRAPSGRRFGSLFNLLPSGAAYHRMVYDDEGAPADYIFLEINDAFEQSTGLERKALIGRSVS